MKIITGTWTYADGTPASGAKLWLSLPQDAVVVGTAQIIPRLVGFVLDNTGSLVANTKIVFSDEMSPSQLAYTASVVAPGGGLIWGAESVLVTGASFNFSNAVPTTISVLLANPVLLNPTADQTITGFNLTAPIFNGVTGFRVNGGAASGNYLRGNGTNFVSAALTITDATGILPTANGGTGQNSTLVFPTSGNVVTEAATETLTNKRVNPRVVSLTDATSVTFTGDTADVNTQVNTQAGGTLTVNSPSGTPVNGQRLTFRIKSTNVQTYSWNAIFRGSTSVPLPTTTTGSSKTDYIGFMFNTADTKWDCVAAVSGYT